MPVKQLVTSQAAIAATRLLAAMEQYHPYARHQPRSSYVGQAAYYSQAASRSQQLNARPTSPSCSSLAMQLVRRLSGLLQPSSLAQLAARRSYDPVLSKTILKLPALPCRPL